MKRIVKQVALLLAVLLVMMGLVGCGAKEITKQEITSQNITEIKVFEDSETVSAAESESYGDTEIRETLSEENEATEIETVGSEADDGFSDKQEKNDDTAEESETAVSQETQTLDPDGSYQSKDEVALYIHTYGKLPSNYISKKEAEKLGWSGGSLEKYAPGKCIGGSNFGNYEGILPKGKYTECDIDTLGAKKRGAKRIVFSTDGNIFYTEDHYETFILLYTAEGPVSEETIYGK